MLKKRESVRGLIVDKTNGQKRIVLIHRIKNGNEYWVLPGGGVKEGEGHIETLDREIEEELGSVKIYWKNFIQQLSIEIDDYLSIENIYLGEYIEGDITTGKGEEYTLRSDKNNMYNPEFINREQLGSINILPVQVKNIIFDILNHA